ncbi:MAG TPA: transposase [Candidatus Acidoferrales bacterium]|nr:transposase [Candidatus Acidoferrales bacterium]
MSMKIGHKLAQFAAQMGRGCSRPVYKFIRDMLTGMVAKKSILLSDVGRALNEPTDLLYTEKRLSRNLCHADVGDDDIRERYLETVHADTKGAVIAFDLSEIRKEYAKDMPYLAGVYDSSAKETGDGWWLTMCEAIRPDGKHIPLWMKTYSQKTPGFVSENAEIIETVRRIAAHTDRSAMWVFDRGFDRPKLMTACEELGITYVIRQVGKRNIANADETDLTFRIASKVRMPYRFAWRSIRHGKPRPIEYRCGSTLVQFPDGHKAQLLVMHHGTFREPMMLVSNCLDTRRETVIRLCLAYLRRWSIEEATRAIKQCFALENVRALTWTGIQRMVLFAFLAWGFLCKIAKTLKVKSAKILGFSKWFGEVPEFFYYRLAESVALLLLFSCRSS